MPNHVYNRLVVQGNSSEITRFKLQAAQVDQENPDCDAPFSFWNFVRPSQESLDSGRYHATNGWVNGKQSGDTPDNWYNWNNTHWGTKWDAYDVQLQIDTSLRLQYTFTTAWSVAAPVLTAMTEQFPELTFSLFYEEEQGWGGLLVGDQGIVVQAREYDVPKSHADATLTPDRFEKDCWCDDDYRPFADCPKVSVDA